MSTGFQPPGFQPHPLLRSGHLQTVASIRLRAEIPWQVSQHVVPLGDGDSIVLHEDMPPGWGPGDASILLIHGLCGCHAASYMLRLADRFYHRGVRVFRIDMRGCGAGIHLARQLTHAGRSDDIMAALAFIAGHTESGPLGAIGISLGGNQLLRGAGRVGAGCDRRPEWFDRLTRIAVISPPVNLGRCSENMQRWVLRPYNYYFIRLLLERVPDQVRERRDFQQSLAAGRPKTLFQLDDRITAPLSGFADAADYYQQASAMHVTADNPIRTLVIVAADDPVVPLDCFTGSAARWSATTELLISPRGGHVGFIDRQRRCWSDEVLDAWFGDD